MNKPLLPDSLRHLIPLNVLSPRQLQSFRAQLQPRSLKAAEWLFCDEACAGSRFYLLDGQLALYAADGGQRILVGGSAQSAHAFGVGSGVQRAQALDEASVLVIDGRELDRLVNWQQNHADLLLELASEDGLPDWLEALLDNPLFGRVPAQNVRAMLARLGEIHLSAGQVLLREGEAGDCCYFLQSGRAEVMTGAGSERQVVAELEIGACFGEEALLTEGPRNATVTLLEDACVLRLERQDFIELLQAPVVAEVDLEQAGVLIAQGAQWLDVRLQQEYEQGHAARALNMPLHLLRLKTRLLDRERVYLCYCDSGKRSASAVFLLTQMGFTAYPLRGGIAGLSAADYAALMVEQGSGYLARSGGRTERSG